jgi:hypothetical protein
LPHIQPTTAVRERARIDEEKAKKPYEAEKTAERAILAEKSKQKTAAGRWPPAGGQQKSVDEQPVAKDEVKKEPPKGPSWRDRMAKKEEEPVQERKGYLK